MPLDKLVRPVLLVPPGLQETQAPPELLVPPELRETRAPPELLAPLVKRVRPEIQA